MRGADLLVRALAGAGGQGGVQGRGGPTTGDPTIMTHVLVQCERGFSGYFTVAQSLGATTETVVHKVTDSSGNPVNMNLPGASRYAALELVRWLTNDAGAENFYALVLAGRAPDARGNCELSVLDQASNVIAKWRLVNAWPAGYLVEQTAETQMFREKLTLVYDRFERIGP